MLFHELVHGPDEDVLALALADRTDVHHERGVGVQAVLAAQGSFVVGGGKTLDPLDVHPAGEGAEVVVGIELLEKLPGGAGREDDAAGVLDGLLHQRDDLGRREIVLGEELARGIALVDVEGRGFAEQLAEDDDPVGQHRVADEEIDVRPLQAGGKGLDFLVEDGRGRGIDETAGVEHLHPQTGVLELPPQRPLDG